LADREQVSWGEVGETPLCLLTPDMQNRRIIDRLLRAAGCEPAPTLESNSMMVLVAHVRTGRWSSVMPAKVAETLGLTELIRAIPIASDAPDPVIGLIVPDQDPMTALTAALVTEARRLAAAEGLSAH
jgi:DNA-binding transcriptional LysR family regulator